jgi:hypothetical protein
MNNSEPLGKKMSSKEVKVGKKRKEQEVKLVGKKRKEQEVNEEVKLVGKSQRRFFTTPRMTLAPPRGPVSGPTLRAASPVARAGKHPPVQRVRDDCSKGGLLRGLKQKSWREDDSDSTEDQEDPREEECSCQVWMDGRAHVPGDGCAFIRGSRGICDCLYKWSMHTPACNGAYTALPEVWADSRADWLLDRHLH